MNLWPDRHWIFLKLLFQYLTLILKSIIFISILFFLLRLDLFGDHFPISSTAKILKAILPSSILVICPTHLNLLVILYLPFILCAFYALVFAVVLIFSHIWMHWHDRARLFLFPKIKNNLKGSLFYYHRRD